MGSVRKRIDLELPARRSGNSAEWLSKRAGEVTQAGAVGGRSRKPGRYGSASKLVAEKRPRIAVAKMFGMPQGRALVWLPGDEAPRVSWIKGYFEIGKLNARASKNPYYSG